MAVVTSAFDVTEWTANENATGNDVSNRTSGYSVAETVGIGLALVVLIVVTVGGNLLVCVTIGTDRKLRTATNYFLLSLAVTDLLLGCCVLPVSAFATLNGDQPWTLGAAFCNVYVSTDVTLCTASILILFAISLLLCCCCSKPHITGVYGFTSTCCTSTPVRFFQIIFTFRIFSSCVTICSPSASTATSPYASRSATTTPSAFDLSGSSTPQSGSSPFWPASYRSMPAGTRWTARCRTGRSPTSASLS